MDVLGKYYLLKPVAHCVAKLASDAILLSAKGLGPAAELYAFSSLRSET